MDILHYHHDAELVLHKARTNKSRALLLLLEKYINGVTIQLKRIEEVKDDIKSHHSPGKTDINMEKLFLDIHFYFTCVALINKLGKEFAKEEKNKEIYKIWNSINKITLAFPEARNHLEHIEKRFIPQYLSDFGNLIDDNFSFGGKRFPVNADTYILISEAYNRLISILKTRKIIS